MSDQQARIPANTDWGNLDWDAKTLKSRVDYPNEKINSVEAEVVKKWHRHKDDQGHPFHLIVIVVTDEVGDDEARLEEAIAAAKSARAPIYVLGSSALFGRVEGRRTPTPLDAVLAVKE